ncbi:MAG: RNA polymerase sigma factor, partial [Lutisporaceae bacterium]
TQDTFVKVFKGLSKVETDIKLSPWIYRIAHNACIDHIRKHKITFELLDNVNYENDIKDIKGDDNPEVNYINIELRDKINKVMMRLNNRYKTVLILRDYNDLSYKNIAEILGLSEAGIKSLIHRARLEFQKIFKEMSNNEL